MTYWPRLVLAAALLGELAGLAGRGTPTGKGEDAARAALRQLERLASDPQGDARELWEGVIRLQRLYPGTAEAASARHLLSRVRSPLDCLEARQIPKEERFDWQPKGLVAVLGTHGRRHWGEVGQVAFHPDGKLLASASGDGLCLWDAATLRQKFWLKGGHGFSFAPDGKTLAVKEGNAIRLYGLEGKRLKPGIALRKDGHQLSWFAFAPKGRLLMACYWDVKAPAAVNSKDRVFVLWQWGKAGAKAEELPRIAKPALNGTFSADGKFFAHHGRGDNLYVWALTKQAPGRWATLAGVRSFAFSPDAVILITYQVRRGRKLTVWDIQGQKPQELGSFVPPGYWGQLHFSPDGRLLLGIGDYGKLRLLDMGELRRHLTGKGPPPQPRLLKLPFKTSSTLCFSPDSRLLAVGTRDGAVRLWDVANGAEYLPPKSAAQAWAEFSPDGRTLATFGADRMLRLWDLGGTRPKQIAACALGDADEPIARLHFAPGGDLLTGSGRNGQQVRLWRLRGKRLESLPSFRIGAQELLGWAGFTPQGELLITGTKYFDDLKKQPFIAVYRLGQDRNRPQRVQTYLVGSPQGSGGDYVPGIPAFSADGRRLALATLSTAYLWDWHPRRMQLTTAEKKGSMYSCVTLSEDGSELVMGGRQLTRRDRLLELKGLTFWGLKGGILRGQGSMLGEDAEEPYRVAFALGGKALFVTSTESYVLLDRGSQRKLWSWHPPGHSGAWATLAPDGRHVALCNANGTVYIVRLKEASKP